MGISDLLPWSVLGGLGRGAISGYQAWQQQSFPSKLYCWPLAIILMVEFAWVLLVTWLACKIVRVGDPRKHNSGA